MRVLMILLLAATLAAPHTVAVGSAEAVPGAKTLLEAAQQEGKMSFCGNITAIEPVMDAFAHEFHVKGVYTRFSSSKFLHIVATGLEAGRIQADVLQAPLPILQSLKRKGLLAPCPSPQAARFPEWARSDDAIQVFGIECAALIYNSERVRPEDVPKSYQDLAKPQWRHRIVMPDPCSHDATLSWLVGLREKIFPTEAAWMAFLRGLARNKPMFVPSFGSTPQSIAAGEKWIGISLPKYILTRSPAPLNWAPRDQPLFGTPRGIAVAASAPHPHAARLFVDYWLSDEAMTLLAQKTGEYVLATGVHPPIPGMEKAEVHPLTELSQAEIKRWRPLFRKIFHPSGSAGK